MDRAPGFGEALQRYRRARGFTQAELAEQAQISVRAVSDLERGLKVVDGQLVLELIEDGPEPVVRAAPAETEHGYGSGKPTLARVKHDGHLAWQEPL